MNTIKKSLPWTMKALLVIIFFHTGALLLWLVIRNPNPSTSVGGATVTVAHKPSREKKTAIHSDGKLFSKMTACFPERDGCPSYLATRRDVPSSVDKQMIPSACVSELGVVEDLRSTGFASLLLMTLDHISLCILGGSRPVIYWKGGLSFTNNRKSSLNSWNLFFEPLSQNSEIGAKRVICMGRMITSYDFKQFTRKVNTSQLGNGESSFIPTTILNLKFRKSNVEFDGLISAEATHWANSLLKRFVKISKPIRRKVETFYRKYLHGYNLLGVHIRGTDHVLETESKQLPELEVWLREAEIIFSTMQTPKKLFVASDSKEAIKRVVGHFGKADVVYTNSLRAALYRGLDIQHASPPVSTLRRMATDVLMDILLLSRCHHFLHAESSVSALAVYFNPNMKSYFLGELTTEKGTRTTMSSHEEPTNREEEDDEDSNDLLELSRNYKKNSHTSVCPDMRSGNFLPSSQLGYFLIDR